MRVLVLLKCSGEKVHSERTELAAFDAEMRRAGVLENGDELGAGATIRFQGEQREIVMTTLPEGVIAQRVWKVDSLEEAIVWARRFPLLEESQELEIRPFNTHAEAAPPSGTVTQSEKVFLNIPVKELSRSITFFKALGYEFDARFSDDNAACLKLGPTIHAMLIAEPYFRTFTTKSVVDARKSVETIIALSAPTRAEVDRIVSTALASGGRKHKDPTDHGVMYEWGFEDPDGHIWEYLWLDVGGALKEDEEA